MQWYNEPQQWAGDAHKLTVEVAGKTDYWRVTRHHFIKDDAPFYYQEVSGNFSARVQIRAAYAALYDQAGLMLREDETTWLKCGIEYLDGVQQASAVITREFSDWSILPLLDNPAAIWFRIDRIAEAVEVSYSRDGEEWVLIRQGYLTTADTLHIGLMAAAPTGDGFQVVFEDFIVTPLP